MTSKHGHGIALCVVCFAGGAFVAIPTGDDDELTDQIRQVTRTVVDVDTDCIAATVEGDFVRLGKTVEAQEQTNEIVEAVEPVIGKRELRHEQKIDQVTVQENSIQPGDAQK